MALTKIDKINKLINNVSPTLFTALAIKSFLIWAAYMPTTNLYDYFGINVSGTNSLIDFAPEVWVSLLAFVFGTLIIVISIAAASTPKLIDLFISDVRSRLYIWLITLSTAENIILQPQSRENLFVNNLIFVNSYLLLPLFGIIAIPYIYYILSFTKNSNVIDLISKENRAAIRNAVKTTSAKKINANHYTLIETINQLQDLHQYIQFKEPKGVIIHRMGESLRLYIRLKPDFPNQYFILGNVVKDDFHFAILEGDYTALEEKKIFYENKVLGALGSSYLLLIKDSHYDLASLCGSELLGVGKVAISMADEENVKLILTQFNTFVRYGINHGLKTREIRCAYNMIYHYSHFVALLVAEQQELKVKLCFQYLCFYLNEVTRLSLSEPLFIVLANSLAAKLKEILITINQHDFKRENQGAMILMMNTSSPMKNQLIVHGRVDVSGFRLIQIATGLFYQSAGEDVYCDYVIKTIVEDIGKLNASDPIEIVDRDFDRLMLEPEEFWEETHQGNRNMFYSPHKDQIPLFKGKVIAKIINMREAKSLSAKEAI